MELWNSGHSKTSHFVLYREVVLSLEVKLYLCSRERASKCVLYRKVFLVVPVSIIGGSTVFRNPTHAVS